MKKNELRSLRDKKPAELNTELLALLKEQFSLRMQHAAQQLNNPAQLGRVRKDIARVRTLLAEQAKVVA